MMLQPYIPGLVEALVAEYAASGQPTLPAGRRGEVVRMLMSVVAPGPLPVDEYCELLTAAVGNDFVPPAGPADLPMEGIFREGVAVLSDDQLARLALNEAAVRELTLRVLEVATSDRLGLCWNDAIMDVVIPPDYYPEERAREVTEGVLRLWRGQ
ncbi:MAG: hypothetical protein K2X91_16545 [Thermoleophilia bacterium]|nr:hypothetical protein [Thermoleophilia bacterium]